MDTTKKNILMCEKAREIQELWNASIGDIIYSKNNGIMFISSEITKDFISKTDIWLPRQGQLQDILFPDTTKDYLWLVGINEVMFNRYKYEYLSQFKTMEQLWLAFAMKEKFHKIWNGEDWINEV